MNSLATIASVCNSWSLNQLAAGQLFALNYQYCACCSNSLFRVLPRSLAFTMIINILHLKMFVSTLSERTKRVTFSGRHYGQKIWQVLLGWSSSAKSNHTRISFGNWSAHSFWLLYNNSINLDIWLHWHLDMARCLSFLWKRYPLATKTIHIFLSIFISPL